MVRKIFFKILLFTSLIANLIFFQNKLEQNRVVEVVDGDTFQLKSGKRVRLMGVDSPEYDLCGGSQAKERLKELLNNKVVTLKEEVTESFGRSLALVFIDGEFINKIIMEEGWGRADYRKNTRRDELTAAFHSAKDKKPEFLGCAVRKLFRLMKNASLKATSPKIPMRNSITCRIAPIMTKL